MFWLSCECFSILHDAFLLKSVISSHNSCAKLAVNWRNGNEVTIFHRQIFVTFCFFFVKFSHWTKFYVNIITGSRVMTISFYKGLIRNPEIGNTPTWVLEIFEDLGELEIPSLTRRSAIRCYWMLQNLRVTAFAVSALLRENQQWRG